MVLVLQSVCSDLLWGQNSSPSTSDLDRVDMLVPRLCCPQRKSHTSGKLIVLNDEISCSIPIAAVWRRKKEKNIVATWGHPCGKNWINLRGISDIKIWKG